MDTISSHFKNPTISSIQKHIFGIYQELKYFLIDKFTRLTKIKQYRPQKNLKLNLGCGTIKKKGFVNIDISKNVDLRLDLRKKLPFQNDSIEYIFSEGFFGYLSYKDGTAINVLRDYLRVLKNGCKIRIVIPDHEKFFTAYTNKNNSYFDKFINLKGQIPQKRKHNSIIDYLNFCLEYGKLGYVYDFEKMSLLLKSVGYKNIIKDKFNPNLDANFKKRPTFSLYIEAEK